MNRTPPPEPSETSRRQAWMAVLSRAGEARLEGCWQALGLEPGYDYLRRPDRGLVMVRGRAGGTGDRFNLGEMTVSRCAVRLDDGTVGHGYVAGRSARHAELAALFDALLQQPSRHDRIQAEVIAPLSADMCTAKAARAAKAAATRVEFYTMVRGED